MNINEHDNKILDKYYDIGSKIYNTEKFDENINYYDEQASFNR
jgi:hypothetical protein